MKILLSEHQSLLLELVRGGGERGGGGGGGRDDTFLWQFLNLALTYTCTYIPYSGKSGGL